MAVTIATTDAGVVENVKDCYPGNGNPHLEVVPEELNTWRRYDANSFDILIPPAKIDYLRLRRRIDELLRGMDDKERIVTPSEYSAWLYSTDRVGYS